MTRYEYHEKKHWNKRFKSFFFIPVIKIIWDLIGKIIANYFYLNHNYWQNSKIFIT